jgi:hypothetical protein
METQEPDESISHLYTRILLLKRIGYPLWFPEPSMYPSGYSGQGVSVGDVGLITYDGHFDFLFNICDTHAVNGQAVSSLEFNEQRQVRRTRQAYPQGAVIASRHIQREPYGPDPR